MKESHAKKMILKDLISDKKLSKDTLKRYILNLTADFLAPTGFAGESIIPQAEVMKALSGYSGESFLAFGEKYYLDKGQSIPEEVRAKLQLLDRCKDSLEKEAEAFSKSEVQANAEKAKKDIKIRNGLIIGLSALSATAIIGVAVAFSMNNLAMGGAFIAVAVALVIATIVSGIKLNSKVKAQITRIQKEAAESITEKVNDIISKAMLEEKTTPHLVKQKILYMITKQVGTGMVDGKVTSKLELMGFTTFVFNAGQRDQKEIGGVIYSKWLGDIIDLSIEKGARSFQEIKESIIQSELNTVSMEKDIIPPVQKEIISVLTEDAKFAAEKAEIDALFKLEAVHKVVKDTIQRVGMMMISVENKQTIQI